FHGILGVQDIGNIVGGTNNSSGNLISGNGQGGITLDRSANYTIQGNILGTDPSGNLDLGNGFSGVLAINSSDNLIESNLAAFNERDGILITDNSLNNRVTQNTTYSNVNLGIDLATTLAPNAFGDGVTPNDPGDPDTGPNNHQNFPVITSASLTGTLDIAYSVDSLNTNSAYPLTAEFFLTDIDGEEGRTYIGSDEYADGAGMRTASINPASAVSPGDRIVATVTDANGNTSEFSANVLVGGMAVTNVLTVNSTGDSPDSNPSDGVCSTGNMVGSDPECTLCAAIQQANALGNASENNPDEIRFAIPADDPNHFYYMDNGIPESVTQTIGTTTAMDDASISGIDPDWPNSWYSITPTSGFPEITDPVVIDGYTQSGAMENSNPNGQGLNGILRISIDGSNTADRVEEGLFRITGGGSTVRGLNINRADGPEIQLETLGENAIEGCYLGPDVSGSYRFPRPSGGIVIIPRPSVRVLSAENTMGGENSSSRNLISGNSLDPGIEVGSLFSPTGTERNLVQSNLIGTDRSGLKSLPNRGAGIIVQNATDNTIGGVGLGNVISGNMGLSVADKGVIIRQETSGNLFRENEIGTDVTGEGPLPNGSEGVEIESSGSILHGNHIAYNLRSGVLIKEGVENTLTENSIHDNGGLGIDIEVDPEDELDGINLPQDPGDGDEGPNNQQNFPTFTSLSSNGSGITAEGKLNSTPNSTFTIEFFLSEDLDFTGFGEGALYIGTTQVTTDSNGDATFSESLPAAPAGYEFITCTATDPGGNTSEFNGAFPVEGCGVVVTNDQFKGPGTLRRALYCANAIEGVDTVSFNIPGQGPHTIQVEDGLPNIIDPIIIDGYTQPGASANTNPIGTPVNSVIQIQIDGTDTPDFVPGLLLSAGSSIVRGLSITHFTDGFEGAAIYISERDDNIITGNYLGVAPDGSTAGNDFGVFINRTLNNRVGGPNPADSNVISGNDDSGVETNGGGSGEGALGTLIQGNLIGVDPTGSMGRPNLLGIDANGNGATIRDNLIAFNETVGVYVHRESINNPAAREVAILGNSIFSNGGLGIDLTGDGVTTNDLGNPPDQDTGSNDLQNFPGLTSRSDSPTTVLEGTLNSTPSTDFRIEFFSNTTPDLSGFGEGEEYLGSVDVTTDGDGSASISFDTGVAVPEDRSVTATATRKDEMGTPVETSEFSSGIGGPGACMPVVTNTNDSGDGSLRQAILCANLTAGMDTITFDIPGDGPHTILLESPLPIITDPVVIDGYTQPGAFPNSDPAGFDGSIMVEIAGDNVDPGFSGLTVSTEGCTIQGLAIGGFEGFLSPDEQDVFGGSAILLSGVGNNTVQGNFLGTDASGTIARPNAFGVTCIFNEGSGPNTVGGSSPAHRNVASGNTYSGILLQENSGIGNVVQGNFVGVDSTGIRKLPNGENGVFIIADSNNLIGGPISGAGNVIGGNLFRGVGLVEPESSRNLIQNNYIGTDFTRSVDLGNAIEGILLFEAGTDNSMLRNSIAFNGDMGIDLEGDGPDVNDIPPDSVPPDQDTGSNNRQNYPVISMVSSRVNSTDIHGGLQSLPDSAFRIDFYANTVCDVTGYGEGQFPIGSEVVFTDSNGLAGIEVNLESEVATGDFVTSTATLIDATGNPSDTSEFSLCFEVTDGVEPTPTPTEGPVIECGNLDFDGNQIVDSRDLLMLLAAIDSGDLNFDLTGDNLVNDDDVFRFSQCWYAMTNAR
ncbi:MAG: right-handed parallel beta-helix repeat-containing protein, partial [Candidatus Omnitrophica bacterium]|nr:right-handed parallel beta-helix repeat-containing protein [Candidatus Omnitrophota bacterium]